MLHQIPNPHILQNQFCIPWMESMAHINFADYPIPRQHPPHDVIERSRSRATYLDEQTLTTPPEIDFQARPLHQDYASMPATPLRDLVTAQI